MSAVAVALLFALDARDRYTAGHSAAVAVYAGDVARGLGLSEADRELARVRGLVHDIGMVGLPSGILEKRDPLTPEERARLREHPVIGERVLASVEDCAQVAKIVRHHHERTDGTGYPDGIAADEIPLVSRIVSVAEEYNAMTSNRPYRDAMPSRVARMRLARESKVSSTPMWLGLSRRSWPMQQRTIEPPPAKTFVPRQH